jgi:hypothetical protein
MAIVSLAGHGEPPGPELPGQSPGRQENPTMTSNTPSAAAPGRPARSLAAGAAFPGHRRVRPIKLGSAGGPE